MSIERGLLGPIPYAAIGSGRPVVVLAGLSSITGPGGDNFVRGTLAPVRSARGRRLIVLNRRPGLPAKLTMAELAAEHAEAIRALDEPADVVGISTGGSIAQQLAAEHPDTVRRLVLISTACRLSPDGRRLQRRVADELLAGRTRAAAGIAAASLVPKGLDPAAYAVGWAVARRAIASQQAADDLIATIEAEDGFDLASCAGPVQAPTLLVAGGRDRFYETALFHETADVIPRCQLLLRPKRGHITVTRDRVSLATIGGFLA